MRRQVDYLADLTADYDNHDGASWVGPLYGVDDAFFRVLLDADRTVGSLVET